MDVSLVDGTYELFRYFYAVPSAQDPRGQEIGAVRGVLASIFSMLEAGTTHIGVATDHIVESFRNQLYVGYKTSEGVPPELLSQFPLLEQALAQLGVLVWPMVEFEADDALASAAAKAVRHPDVNQILICTPDKDLAQSVVGTRIVQVDRRRQIVRDEPGVVAKFGISPQSIPDYLALVGDTADGFPGIDGWGEKTAATVLQKYRHLEEIPRDWRTWSLPIRRAAALADSLFRMWDEAVLFRTLATLRSDVPVFEDLDELRWRGPRPEFETLCQGMRLTDFAGRVRKLARERSQPGDAAEKLP